MVTLSLYIAVLPEDYYTSVMEWMPLEESYWY